LNNASLGIKLEGSKDNYFVNKLPNQNITYPVNASNYQYGSCTGVGGSCTLITSALSCGVGEGCVYWDGVACQFNYLSFICLGYTNQAACETGTAGRCSWGTNNWRNATNNNFVFVNSGVSYFNATWYLHQSYVFSRFIFKNGKILKGQ
jgi:hypothetical protein